nr:uncharacterized protein LOC122270944 [Parasteatoda tepidariorum]
MFLSSDLNKAYVNFLLHILPVFEHFNVTLQCKSPKIHILRQLMNELFKTLLSKFMLPNVVKSSKSFLEVNFYSRDNQKDDVDLVVGQTTNKIVESLSDKEKKSFYAHIRKYFVKVCDYMRQKFPFNDEVVINAEFANMENFDKASFSSVKFFIDRFPGLLKSLGDCSTVDELQSQFNSLQLEDFLGSLESEQRIDSKWDKLCAMFKNKYDLLSKFMLSILAIPHINSECERIFSLVTKAHTQFRSSMTAKNLENLMTVKPKYSEPCFKQKFDDDFLKRAKSATVNKFAS